MEKASVTNVDAVHVVEETEEMDEDDGNDAAALGGAHYMVSGHLLSGVTPLLSVCGTIIKDILPIITCYKSSEQR